MSFQRHIHQTSVSALALLIAGTAHAQVTGAVDPAADTQVLADPSIAPKASSETTASAGDIVVTGSRLRRRDADSVGALLTISSDDIAKSGASSVGDLLQKVPAVGVSLNSNGTQGTSYGASSINLRYLGGAEGSGNRVLVLVDGHRWVDAVGQRGFRDFVDLNTMPQGMIDGVEVLKDGASAIYGADAIAGVVNIKTVQPFDGLRGSVKAGVTDKGDGAEYTGILTAGKRWDRASLVVSASYFKSEPILTFARSRTAVSLVPVATPGTSPNGLFVVPGLSNNAYFGTSAGFANSANPIAYNGSGFGAGRAADNSFHVASLPGDYYNTQAQGIYSTGPSERYGFHGRFEYEVSDAIKARVEGMYNRRTSSQLFAPWNLDIGGTAGTIRGFAIPVNQAFNPFGTANGVPATNAIALPATAAWRVRRILDAVGNRDNTQDVETFRVAAGLDGRLSLFGQEWHWDAFASYSKNKIQSAALNQINYDALYRGLGAPAACAATAGCVPINIFGTMTAEQADYIRYDAYESNQTELYDATANLSGTILELPAGPLALAVGYEYRQNRAEDHPDVFANTPSAVLSSAYTSTSVQTRTASRGAYNLHEVYGELAIPVFKDQPFAQSLDIDLAGRYSRYSTVGGKATFKAGVGYRPIQDVLIRGTYSQGFRAPSILELYQGARQANFQGIDPCNGGAAARPELPGCAGIPAGYNQANYNLNGLIPGTVSGNTRLRPETAETFSGGVAFSPTFLKGFTLTVDYFNITVKNAIALQTSTQIMQLCATRGGALCDLVSRDAGTGAVVDLVQAVQNLNSIKTDGIDATARYDFRTDIGAFGVMVDASYLRSFRTTSPNPAGGEIVDERAGKGDQPRASYPRWKGSASLNWVLDNVDAVIRARYIGPVTDAVNPVKDDRTKSIIYTDAELGFGIDDNRFRLSVGVNNLFDVQPPASYANAPINYDIYTYDARGRFMYVRAAVKM